MRPFRLLALAAVAVPSAALAVVCSVAASPVAPPTIGGWGDSIMFGICSTTSPLATLDGLLPGGTAQGWYVSNHAVSGETAAQIRARYTAEEATACGGQRCAVAYVEGGVNSLRAGVTPAATLADMVAVVDDALGKGVEVVWTDVTPYGAFDGAGANPQAQAESYNALMLAACQMRATNPRLRCTFNYSSAVDPTNPGRLLPAYTCDGIHLTQAGTNILAAAARAAVESIRGANFR